MSGAEKLLPKELTPQETAALLQRILERVEKAPRRHWVQITAAIATGGGLLVALFGRRLGRVLQPG